MAQHNQPSPRAAYVRHDGEWLLPSNRRLRNLTSISLRNLALASALPVRTHRQAIDDDAVPQTLKSPAKLLALKERKGLNHARSSTDLRATAEDSIAESDETSNHQNANGSPSVPKQRHRLSDATKSMVKRPEFKRMRRSTLEWTNATPQARQEKLETLAHEHMADVFFSLHVYGIPDPIYISETVNQTMNPSFQRIDWSTCGSGTTRLAHLSLRIWVHGENDDNWRRLVDRNVDLQELRYLSKELESFEGSLPPNAVLFHMADGIYTIFPDTFLEVGSVAEPNPTPGSEAPTHLSPTSSFDALLRLAKLDDSIQDALATRDRISQELESLLQANSRTLTDRDCVTEGKDRIETIEFAKKTVERQIEKARKQQTEKSGSIAARRKLMDSFNVYRSENQARMADSQFEIPSMHDECSIRKIVIQNQRRRVCEELQTCFPIQPRPGKALAFTIRGLHLPNSEDLDSEPPDVISAALGHVSQVLQLISFYYSHPLPYPVNLRGSSSTIYDPISILKTNTAITSSSAEHALRTYPLFSKSVPRFRFEYAVFLLNQDIRILLESLFSIRVPDVRQTLPNLKYLLYVATAGEGELPARKAGGVRGLLKSPMRRTGSSDSVNSGLSGLTLQGNGKVADAMASLKRFGGKGG